MTTHVPGSVCLVVPTRHEQDNVGELLERIDAALAPYDFEWQILFVDDSDDETPALIEVLAESYPPGRVRLMHRPPNERRGSIAGAIIAGAQAAGTDVICVLDADLQHPPEILPFMIAPLLLDRADVCVPGRYLLGASAEGLERRWRRMASRGSGIAIQVVFPETRLVNDPGGGLFALRGEVIEGVRLNPCGFKSLAEVLVRGRWTRHCEFPYVFERREGGTSKAMLRHGGPFVGHLARMWVDTRLRSGARRSPRRKVAPVDPLVLRVGRDPTSPLPARSLST
jgi:dolichol-phosphate mannosyltransferase